MHSLIFALEGHYLQFIHYDAQFSCTSERKKNTGLYPIFTFQLRVSARSFWEVIIFLLGVCEYLGMILLYGGQRGQHVD